jgi:hypothetical protein
MVRPPAFLLPLPACLLPLPALLALLPPAALLGVMLLLICCRCPGTNRPLGVWVA